MTVVVAVILAWIRDIELQKKILVVVDLVPIFPPFVPRNCPMGRNESELESVILWLTMEWFHGQFSCSDSHSPYRSSLSPALVIAVVINSQTSDWSYICALACKICNKFNTKGATVFCLVIFLFSLQCHCDEEILWGWFPLVTEIDARVDVMAKIFPKCKCICTDFEYDCLNIEMYLFKL